MILSCFWQVTKFDKFPKIKSFVAFTLRLENKVEVGRSNAHTELSNGFPERLHCRFQRLLNQPSSTVPRHPSHRESWSSVSYCLLYCFPSWTMSCLRIAANPTNPTTMSLQLRSLSAELLTWVILLSRQLLQGRHYCAHFPGEETNFSMLDKSSAVTDFRGGI